MRRFFGKFNGEKIIVCDEEMNHMKNAVRLPVGEQIIVSVGDENDYMCEIESYQKREAVCKVNGKRLCTGNPKKNIVIFQAITKREKFEFIVQKATEIGISKVVPFTSEFVIAKVTDSKMDRLNNIAINACKQCERSIPTEIGKPLDVQGVVDSFKDFDVVLFANERTDKGVKFPNLKNCKNIAIIVGSEGGFSQKEKEKFLDAGATSISLGSRIYRCETASVVMMGLVSVLSEN